MPKELRHTLEIGSDFPIAGQVFRFAGHNEAGIALRALPDARKRMSLNLCIRAHAIASSRARTSENKPGCRDSRSALATFRQATSKYDSFNSIPTARRPSLTAP